MPFYENHSHCRWLSYHYRCLSEVEFILSEAEVAKTPRQIFERLSSHMAEMFPSTSLRLLSGQVLRERI